MPDGWGNIDPMSEAVWNSVVFPCGIGVLIGIAGLIYARWLGKH
jgi:hypothetical protein